VDISDFDLLSLTFRAQNDGTTPVGHSLIKYIISSHQISAYILVALW